MTMVTDNVRICATTREQFEAWHRNIARSQLEQFEAATLKALAAGDAVELERLCDEAEASSWR